MTTRPRTGARRQLTWTSARELAAVLGQYQPPRADGLPANFLRDFRVLVAGAPALHAEYLTARAAAERDLGEAIAGRAAAMGPLRSAVLAAMVAGAERAAVMHWMQAPSGSLVATVREAIEQAVAGIGGTS